MSNSPSFNILPLHEEVLLTESQRKSYYQYFRAYARNRKLTNTTKGATFWGPRLKKATNRIASLLIKALCAKGAETIVDGLENIPAGPVLFAFTHQGLLDNFIWIPSCPYHSILFHADTARKALYTVQLNTGLIIVNKDNKIDRMNAKLDAIKLLLEGHSISMWPESTWLLSPNKLHLPMNYGFLDIARKAEVPVVPVACEYTYRTESEKNTAIIKTHLRYCNPIYVGMDANLNALLDVYSETVSTARYEMIEENGFFQRSDITTWDYINYLKYNKRSFSIAKIDIDGERRNIYGYDNDFYRFHHINDFRYDAAGNLMETEEIESFWKRIKPDLNNAFIFRR